MQILIFLWLMSITVGLLFLLVFYWKIEGTILNVDKRIFRVVNILENRILKLEKWKGTTILTTDKEA